MALTMKRVEKLVQPGRYHDEHGLYLQVISKTNKSWILRYTRGGRERWLGLGPAHAFTLHEARERARQARKLIADGIDPIDAKRSEKVARKLAVAKAVTFKEAARRFIEAHEPSWRNQKHRNQWWATLKAYVFPVFGELPVSAIDVGLVMKVLQPIWTSKPETATRVRGRIESILDWAGAHGFRSGDNPARWRGFLDKLLPARSKVRAVRHHDALAYVDLPAFMAELAARAGIAARALEFTILTAARTGEVIGARWSEIDVAAGAWVVPQERMKAGREHRVPLSAPALAILAELPREGEYVFPGAREGEAISNMTMMAVVRRMKRNNITIHGFRSTFCDWAAERTGYPNEAIEMSLAHTISNKVEAAYRRGDLFERRRRLMSDWATYCGGGVVSADSDGKVRPLRGAA
jgi:integrase